MPTAKTLVLYNDAYHILHVNASFRIGLGRLSVTGLLSAEIRNTLLASIGAINDIDTFVENFDPGIFAEKDLHVVFHIPSAINVPVVGTSYGLALSMAILAAAINKTLPPDIIFTGCIGPAGEVLPVEAINEKRKAAKKLGFKKIMLPGSQLDMMSNIIIQCPVHSIREAFSVTFYAD